MKWNASTVADELGINRTRNGDLSEMVKALGMLTFLNTPEDEKRRSAAQWALRNWKAYQAECNARRDNPPRIIRSTRLQALLRYHVTGAIERGEAQAIEEKKP